MIKPMVFVFVLLKFDAILGDVCGTWELAQFLGNKMSPGLFQDFPTDELSSVVVVSGVYQVLVTSSIPICG